VLFIVVFPTLLTPSLTELFSNNPSNPLLALTLNLDICYLGVALHIHIAFIYLSV